MGKKNNILVVVNRGAAELDWLMPILFVLKKNFNIYFFFNSKKSFKSLKENKNLYYFFRDIKSEFYIKSNLENLHLRLIRLFLKLFINFNFFFNLVEYYNDRINNVLKFNYNDKNINFEMSFFEYASNSGIPSFLKKNSSTKIIYYPGTTYPLTTNKKHAYLKKIKIIGDTILVNSSNKKYSKNFPKKKVIFIGNPKFENWWIKKFFKIDKTNTHKSVLFAYNAHRDLDKIVQEKFEKQLFSIMKILTSFKSLKIIFKIHPFKNNPYYLNVLKKFSNNNIKISNEHLLDIGFKSNLIIAPNNSAAVIEGILCKKPTLELWDPSFFLTSKADKDFTNNVLINNEIEFKKFLIIGLNQPKNLIWKKQYNNFKTFFKLKPILPKEIETKIKQIIKK